MEKSRMEERLERIKRLLENGKEKSLYEKRLEEKEKLIKEIPEW
eukprot:CAMPEP_0176364632 /NCGR_PEP_ID=MMETSP0126-20121128/19917_1 /TAXON_ID=141414 ORGANISM="Strombidinopsis acuminatum, Strain SPMC142" /NCGR_SAMPLE_ID=MMETSP0126 /ASSEMBLY_ACC=CAM_ASM_000229 /LENGTH=43 /DNA_ID= /DNA_START= /DNA_END= /DNA_ORIENTATION=